MKTYKSYLFRGKDPVIDELRTIVEKWSGEANITYSHLRKIEQAGGPTASCMAGWFFGKTKRPNNPTIEAAGRAVGKKRVWVNA